MFTLPRLTARVAVVASFTALLAACSPDSNGPSGPKSLAGSNSLAASRSLFLTAATAPSLGAAASFALLGGPAVTCTGSTIPVTVTGDVGVFSPINTGVTLTNCTVSGANNPAAVQAGTDFTNAWTNFAPKPTDCDAAHTLLSTITGPRTLFPGVYCTDAALTGTGVLTLDGQGNPNAVWIFEIGTNPTGTGALTGTNFSVNMIHSGQPCNVYWRVAEAATFTWTTTPSTTSNFVGTILAGAAIKFTGMTSAPGNFVGRALAKAAVTMTDMNVTNSCGAGGGGGRGDDGDKDKGDRDHHGDGDRDHHGDRDRDHHGDGDRDHHGEDGHHGEHGGE